MLVLTGRWIRRIFVMLAVGLAAGKCGAGMGMFASLLVSVLAYAYLFGCQYAAGLVLLLLFHELGHVLAARVVGVRSSWPMFIPFFGAVVRLRRAPSNAKMAANIAIGGPAAGAMSAAVCFLGFLWTDQVLLLALAYTACLFNLFNLIPADLLDGGAVGAAISPHLWRAGCLAIGGVFFYTGNAVVFLIFLFSLQKFWHAAPEDAAYYRLPLGQRLWVLLWYISLIAVLALIAWCAGSYLR